MGGWTSDVGQGQCQEKFFMVGRMVGRQTAEKKRRNNFVLGSPVFRHLVQIFVAYNLNCYAELGKRV